MLTEKVLSAQERKKRGVRLKRKQPQIQRAREIKRHRHADPKALQRRALALAYSIFRDKIAGRGFGKKYATGKIPVSMKIVIDAMLDNKRKQIRALAKRLSGVVSRAEVARLQGVRRGGKEREMRGDKGKQIRESLIISKYLIEGNDARLDDLLRLGIGKKSDIELYKKLLKNKSSSHNFELYRKKLMNFVDNLVDDILSDDQLYNRVKQKLLKKKLDD